MPKKQTPAKTEHHKKVRNWLLLMVICHSVFVLMECIVYDLILSLVVSECFRAWLAYYSYMTLSTCACWGYICIAMLSTGFGVFNVFSVGGWFLIYIGQLAVQGYGAFMVF